MQDSFRNQRVAWRKQACLLYVSLNLRGLKSDGLSVNLMSDRDQPGEAEHRDSLP